MKERKANPPASGRLPREEEEVLCSVPGYNFMHISNDLHVFSQVALLRMCLNQGHR